MIISGRHFGLAKEMAEETQTATQAVQKSANNLAKPVEQQQQEEQQGEVAAVATSALRMRTRRERGYGYGCGHGMWQQRQRQRRLWQRLWMLRAAHL